MKYVVSLTGEVMIVVRAEGLSDEEKEKRIQATAIKLIQLFFIILFQTIFVLFAAALIPVSAVYLGLYDFEQLANAVSNIYFIIISSIVMIAIIWQLGKSSG